MDIGNESVPVQTPIYGCILRINSIVPSTFNILNYVDILVLL